MQSSSMLLSTGSGVKHHVEVCMQGERQSIQKTRFHGMAHVGLYEMTDRSRIESEDGTQTNCVLSKEVPSKSAAFLDNVGIDL